MGIYKSYFTKIEFNFISIYKYIIYKIQIYVLVMYLIYYL